MQSAQNQLREWYNQQTLHLLQDPEAMVKIKWKGANPLNLPERFKALTSEQLKRRKYHFRPNTEYMYLFSDIDKWVAFSLYLDIVPEDVRLIVLGLLQHCDYASTDRLKKLSEVYKKNQKLLSNQWYYIVEMERLSDYVPAPDHDFILDEVKKWVNPPKPIKHELQGLDFLELYRQGCERFFETGYNSQKERVLHIDEYLRDPMYWATPGSSDAELTKFMNRTETRSYKTRKSKWSTAYAASHDYLKKLFYDPRPQKLMAAPKREPTKARMIISGDMSNYLRMGYVAYWMESVLQKHPNTTLFYDSQQMLTMWLEMVKNTTPQKGRNNASQVNVTLDESEFDRQVTTDMMKIKCESVLNFIMMHAPWEIKLELMNTWLTVMKSIINNGSVVIKVGGRISTVAIFNGILSGWRLTAFFDTLSNIAKIWAFRVALIERCGTEFSYLTDPVTNFTSQGDDIRSRSPSPYHAQLFTGLYAEAGFKVHPGKFFVSGVADEFLRKVAFDGKNLIGYPARGVAALLFRNPISKDPPAGAERIREMCNDWLQVLRRTAGKAAKVLKHMIQDISLGNSIPKADVEKIIHIPSNLGGIGLHPLLLAKVDIKKEVVTYDIEPGSSKLAPLLTQRQDLIPIIDNQWRKGIDWGTHAPRKVEPFTYTITELSSLPNFKAYYLPNLRVQSKTSLQCPRAMEGLSPSVAFAYQKLAMTQNREQLRSVSPEWMDSPSLSVLNRLLVTSSLRVIRDWLDDKLFGNPPKSERLGDIVVPIIYKMIVANNLNGVLLSARVTAKSILKAQLSAELATFDVIKTFPYLVTD